MDEAAAITGLLDIAHKLFKVSLKVGKILYDAIRDKKPDDPLFLLWKAIDALRRTLSTVEATFKKVASIPGMHQDDNLILAPVRTELEECHVYISNFADSLVSGRNQGDPRNAGIVVYAIQRLRLSQEELSTKQFQISSYRQGLQMIVSMITCHVLFDLLAVTSQGFERLEPEQQKLERAIADAAHDAPSNPELEKTAKMVLSETRLGGSGQASIYSGRTSRSRFYSPGEEPDDDSRNAIESSIIELLGAGGEERPEPPLLQEPMSSDSSTFSSGSFSLAQRSKRDRASTITEMTDVDADDDPADASNFLALEMFDQHSKMGRESYKKGKFEEALRSLESALDYANRLQPSTRATLDLNDMQLYLATIYLKRRDVLRAEDILTTLLRSCPQTEGTTSLLMDACFSFAELCLMKSDFKNAEAYCARAMLGRAKVFGTKHVSYYRTQQLLAKIFQKTGRDQDMKAMLNSIPQEMREEVEAGPSLYSAPDSLSRPTISPRPATTSVITSGPAPEKPLKPKERTMSWLSSFRRKSPVSNSGPKSPQSPDSVRQSSFTSRSGSDVCILNNSTLDTQTRETLASGGYSGNFDENAALIWAIQQDHRGVVRILLEGFAFFEPLSPSKGPGPVEGASIKRIKKADVTGDIKSKRNPKSKNPLILATELGKADFVGLLLHADASTSVKDSEGRTPLFIAVTNCHLEIIGVLLARNSSTANVPDRRGRSPLHVAAEAGSLNVVKALLSLGAALAVDQQDQQGRTALALACERGYLSTARALLDEGGAAVDLADQGGRTPLMRAAQLGREEMVRALLDKGAAVDAADKHHRRTALITAAYQGEDCVGVVAALLAAGANPAHKDKEGYTAMYAATRSLRRSGEIVQLLTSSSSSSSAAAAARSGSFANGIPLPQSADQSATWRKFEGKVSNAPVPFVYQQQMGGRYA